MPIRKYAQQDEAAAVESTHEERGPALTDRSYSKIKASKMRPGHVQEMGNSSNARPPIAFMAQGMVSVDDLRHQATRKAKWTAKRFLAIADLLDGKCCFETAREAGVRIDTLNQWKERFDADGIAGLQTRTVRSSIRCDISAETLQNLAKTADARIANRLIAIANLINGMERREVAAVAQTSMNSISRWLKAFNEEGLVGLGSRQQRLRMTARDRVTPAKLREYAKNVDKNFAGRLHAIANVLDGMRCNEAARYAGVAVKTLSNWRRKFEAGGIAALRSYNVSVSCRQDIPATKLRDLAKGCDRLLACRLLAIANLLDGLSYEEVARRASLSIPMIYHLVHQFNAKGISGLAPSRIRGRPAKAPIREDITANELQRAATKAKPEAAIRYKAMASLLEGMNRKDVARATQTSIPTISRWLSQFNAGGMAGLHTSRRRRLTPRTDISRDELREVSKDSGSKTATRLLAIVNLLDGQERAEVARGANISVKTLEVWIRRFNEHGIVGLRHRTK